MHFSQRLLQMTQSTRELSSWRQWAHEFSAWIAPQPGPHQQLLLWQLSQPLPPGRLSPLLDLALWVEEDQWRRLGPTAHDGINRLVAHRDNYSQQLRAEIDWSQRLQGICLSKRPQFGPGSMVRSRAMTALKAEHDSFLQNYLQILKSSLQESQRAGFDPGLNLEELSALGGLYQSVDLRGFCARHQQAPTTVGLLNCFLHAAWQVHHNYLSDRVFSVIREQLTHFFAQLEQSHQELLDSLPDSLALHASLATSLTSIQHLIETIQSLEASDLLNFTQVSTKTQSVFRAYEGWSKVRQEILVLCPVQNEQWQLDELLEDCQSILFEGKSSEVVGSKLQEALTFCDRLLRRSSSSGCQEVCDLVRLLKSRLDFIQLFLDQPKVETLRLIAEHLEEVRDSYEHLELMS